jgi:hypothetical protein
MPSKRTPVYIGDTFASGGAGLYEPVITAGTLVQYWTGSKAWANLNQAAVDGLKTNQSPTLAGLTLSGLSVSVPVVTDGSSKLASQSYANFKTSLVLTQNDIANLTTGSSPVFVNVKCSRLTAGYIPYHVSGAAGLADSGLFWGGNYLSMADYGGGIPDLGAAGGTIRELVGGVRGLIQGHGASGNYYFQVQRIDGTATAYHLLLQPNGGSVIIGATAPVGSEELRVNGPVYCDSTLTLNASITTPAATALTLNPTTNIDLTPGGTALVRTTSGVRIQSDNYASQTTGWGISYAGSGDFRYLYADEMHAKAFIADLEQALAGGQIICKSVAPLAAVFTVPAAGAAATLVVESFKGFDTFRVFVDGDMIRLRQFDRTGTSLTIANCWGTVAWVSTDTTAKTQTYTFTRSANPNGGTASGTIGIGTLALDYGTTGNGYLESNAIDGAMAEYSPYHQVVSWATHPNGGLTIRTRLGNLKGIFNVSNEFGLYAGAGITDASRYIRISDQAAELHNLNIKMFDGATNTVLLSPTAPSFALGNPLPTAFGTGAGIWMGKDTTYKFRVGDPAGGKISWDGTTLTAAGFTIGPTGLYAGTGATRVEMNSGGGFWAGATAIGDAPFSVTNAGALKATSGTVGGWTLSTTDIANAAATVKLRAAGNLAFGATPPTAASAGTGLFLDSTGMYGLAANVQQAVFDAATGAIMSGGGSVKLDSTGIVLADGSVLNGKMQISVGGDAVYQTYTCNSVVGVLEIGVEDNVGATAPRGFIKFTNPTNPSNLLATNPGFEIGDTSGWTASGTGVSLLASIYSPHGGTYCGGLSTNTYAAGVLAAETASANRGAVTAGSSYDYSVWIKSDSIGNPYFILSIIATFYDNGGTSKGTVTISSGPGNPAWAIYNKTIIAPTGATKTGIKISYNCTGSIPYVAIDDALIMGSPAAGALIFDAAGNASFTGGNVSVAGGSVVVGDTNSFNGKVFLGILDDAVYSFTPISTSGFILILTGTNTGDVAIVHGKTAASGSFCAGFVLGANVNVTTGALNGTTGTDGKITISTHTDGKVYIENRRGGNRNFGFTLIAGYGA